MNYKKSIVGVLVLFIVSNLLTTAWYMFTDDANYVSFRRSEINYGGLMLNHLLFAAGFVYLFPNYMKEKKFKLNALAFGVILAAIMFIPTGIVVRSIWTVEFNQVFLLNTLAHLSIGGIMGVVLSIIYNYKKNEIN